MSRDIQVLADDVVREKLDQAGLGQWFIENGWIRRKYMTDGWPSTLMLVNAVGFACEAAWHHADMDVTWGRITVKLKTHSHRGLTDLDIELARRIEDVALWRPGAESALQGSPNKFVFVKE